MKAKRASLLLVAGVFGVLLLSGCGSVEEALDRNWLERAFLNILDKVDQESFDWILLLAIPVMIFAAKALVNSDWVGFTHWFLIMVVGVGSFFEITDVIVSLGRQMWPDSYTISNVMDWFGWSLPFPEDATWVSPFAFAFTEIIPSFYNIWQWGLLVVHGAMLVIVAFSRNTKPIVVDAAFIFSWAITPSILAFATRVIAEAKAEAGSTLTKAILEFIYVFPIGLGTMVVFFVLLPLAVGVAAIFLRFPGPLEYSWAGKDRETLALVKRAAGKIDTDALLAAFAAFFVQVPEPRRTGSNTNSEAGQEPRLLPPPDDAVEGIYRDVGPDDFEPTNPRSPRPTVPDNIGSEKSSPVLEGEGKLPEKDGENDDIFEPRQSNLVSPEPEVNEVNIDSSLEEESEEQTDDEFSTRKGKLSRGLESVGKVARAAGPLVTAVKPEAGLVISSVGELLDEDGEEFPTRKGMSNTTTGDEEKTPGDESGDEDEELFPSKGDQK